MNFDKNFTVLVISDNCASLDILKSILSLRYNVKIATSTSKAMELIKCTEIDLMILDCAIYGYEYFEFLIEIRSSEESMRIPFILIGDSSKPEHEELGFALGAVDYISKPFRASIVKVRVNNQRMLVKQIKAIEELGLIDHLTGISNRRGFDNRVRMEWLRAIRDKMVLSLAVIDIDHFKAYNDDYGHTQGDVLLRSLAKEFVSMLKRPADFVARWGGEEFVLMLPNTNLKGALAHSEDIRKAVQKMVVPNLPSATISIGVASVIPNLNSSVEKLFSMADKALYKAKNTGRNKVCSFS